jgi:hypothetical protein
VQEIGKSDLSGKRACVASECSGLHIGRQGSVSGLTQKAYSADRAALTIFAPRKSPPLGGLAGPPNYYTPGKGRVPGWGPLMEIKNEPGVYLGIANFLFGVSSTLAIASALGGAPITGPLAGAIRVVAILFTYSAVEVNWTGSERVFSGLDLQGPPDKQDDLIGRRPR